MTAQRISLSQAASRYLSNGDGIGDEQGREIFRFVRWCGAERPLSQLRGHDISLYTETLGSTADAARRLELVKRFLSALQKDGLTDSNLGTHLRLRRASGKKRREASQPTPEKVHLTADGEAMMRAELASLLAQRPTVAEEIRLAAHDKDFRENAPLHAAKDKQAHMETRIREIEDNLRNAVVTDNSSQASRVQLGHSVLLRNLSAGGTLRYTVVGPTEANAGEGKISSASPVGRALLEQSEGDEIEVAAPKGALRFRIESIDG